MSSIARRRAKQAAKAIVAATVIYGLLAYVLLPWAWEHHERQSGLRPLPMVTVTADGVPGDPLNVGIVGSLEEIVRAMTAAGWVAADPLTWRTSLRIVDSVLLDRPYHAAPVSALYYAGRREDLAFEKPAGVSPDRRHHVRLWKVLDSGSESRPVWLGAATFDQSVGLSRLTGAVTHHIAPDIDNERDRLAADLAATGAVMRSYAVTGVGPTLFGRNGEGDRYRTDGEILISVLGAPGETAPAAPERLPSPPLVALKDRAFGWMRQDR